MLNRKTPPRKISFHEMHNLWLILSQYRGNTELEIAKETREIEEAFEQACKIVYGKPIQTGVASLDALVLASGLEKVGYLRYRETIDGR